MTKLYVLHVRFNGGKMTTVPFETYELAMAALQGYLDGGAYPRLFEYDQVKELFA